MDLAIEFPCCFHVIDELADRLLGALLVNAGAYQNQQMLHTAALGRFDHVGLDLEVIQKEICRIGVVGMDTTELHGSAPPSVGWCSLNQRCTAEPLRRSKTARLAVSRLL